MFKRLWKGLLRNMSNHAVLTNEKFVNLVKIDYTNNNKSGSWVYATRNKSDIYPKTRCNAVVIAPMIDDKVCIIKEFRPAIGDYVYGFPAGLIDDGESVEDAAKRELFEECGLKITNFEVVSKKNLVSSPGITDEVISMVFVQAVGEPTNKNNESNEDIEVLLLDRREIHKLLIDDSKFICAKSYPSLLAFSELE